MLTICKQTSFSQTCWKESWRTNFHHGEEKWVGSRRRYGRSGEIVSAAATKRGMVVSTKGSKTCIVAIKRRVFHKRYKKVLTVTKRVAVHDPYQSARLGEKVEIVSTRPISKRKRWCLIAGTESTTLLKTARK